MCSGKSFRWSPSPRAFEGSRPEIILIFLISSSIILLMREREREMIYCLESLAWSILLSRSPPDSDPIHPLWHSPNFTCTKWRMTLIERLAHACHTYCGILQWWRDTWSVWCSDARFWISFLDISHCRHGNYFRVVLMVLTCRPRNAWF